MSGVSNTRRLRSLLAAAKKDQELTLDEIVARSEGRVRRSYASNLTKELYRRHPLTREELTDIAEAFGIDYEALRHAHLTDMGLSPAEGTSDATAITLDIPRGVERLTPRQRSAISVMIRAMVDPGESAETDLAPADPDSATGRTLTAEEAEKDAEMRARARAAKKAPRSRGR